MKALQRIMSVLHHEKPDRVPFVPDQELLPRGEFTRQLRNRGMGMCTSWTETFWSGWPNVVFKRKTQKGVTSTIWETPVGSVENRRIQKVADYDPIIFAIRDEVFYRDYVKYDYMTYDFGQDCLIKIAGPCAPYEVSQSYFDTPDRWMSAQREHPDRFARLMDVLAEREQRRFQALVDSPGDVMCFRGTSDRHGPKEFEEYILPFLQKYVPPLHEKKKILCLKTSATKLRGLRDLILLSGVDVIDGFNPPPVGDLSVAEARTAWGNDIVLWVNFPTKVFQEGAEATKRYTKEMLESDPSGRMVIGMTTNTFRVVDDDSARVFQAGMTAIMDALD